MYIRLNVNTQIVGAESLPVQKAAKNLKRDLKKCFFYSKKAGNPIRLEKNISLQTEEYKIFTKEKELVIQASDDLGFIYGIYEVSRSVLGICEFWFWNDQVIIPKEEIQLPFDYQVFSLPFRVRYRGWFVNDEVLISSWSVDQKKEKTWEMVFEALLRLGGNMVIPGTDKNSKKYAKLASEMGLIITHHHAEPMGAEMFARAYPELFPSYQQQSEQYHHLWQEAIDRQKNHKVIWNLGFRGQGDYPFWKNDPAYQTDEARGKLISSLIRIQYDMVKKADSDACCSTNLYGETMELYQKGVLDIPVDVIKIWADNGYGKMVSRRQENHNPRIYSLPEEVEENKVGRHGIYYHVSFYDLQAANHITLLPNPPEFVKKELQKVLKAGADDYWIINCSNVKPHIYYLDLIAQIWRSGDADVEEHREIYVSSYFLATSEENKKQIIQCMQEYHKSAVLYGKEEDEHAGEQFLNHVPRMLISQYMRNPGRFAEDLLWASPEKTLAEQVRWYRGICHEGMEKYEAFSKQCEKTACGLPEDAEQLFRDSWLLQAMIYRYCYRGAYQVTLSLLSSLEKDYKKAFYYAGKARKSYLAADQAMRQREHGKWKGFYQNECLTDIKQTAWVLEGLMAYVRNLDDGPHYYKWQREFLYSEEDRRVMLIMNMENHLKDEEIFELMEKAWG